MGLRCSMWPRDICVFTSSQVTGMGREGSDSELAKTKAFLRSLLWLLRDNNGRERLGNPYIEVTCIQGHGDRAQ